VRERKIEVRGEKMPKEEGRVKEIEELEKELAVPVTITSPGHTKLLERLNVMEEKAEFVAGELALRQGGNIGFVIGILYGLIIGILIYILFMVV